MAGNRDVRLRFEFSTAGGMGFGYAGGRDFEIARRCGSELRDGQTLTVGGRQFEIEMGSLLTIPSGAGIRNLDSFTILGSTFVFWNGTGVAPVGNVIPFLATDSPNALATKVHAAIQLASFNKPTSTV